MAEPLHTRVSMRAFAPLLICRVGRRIMGSSISDVTFRF